jgi:hypothetical protein
VLATVANEVRTDSAISINCKLRMNGASRESKAAGLR